MEAFDLQFSNGCPTIDGKSTIKRNFDIIEQVIDTRFVQLDTSISNALDKLVTEGGDIIYEPRPLNEIAQNKPCTGPVDFNGKRLENIGTVPDLTSIDSILATPNTAVNVTTMGNYTTLQLALNTAYCGPLFSTMNVKGKKITNVSTPYIYTNADSSATIDESVNSAATFGLINQVCLTTAPEDRSNFHCNGRKVLELGSAWIYKDNEVEPPLDGSDLPITEEEAKDQAMNLGTTQEVAVCLDTATRTNYDAKAKRITNGLPARSVGDFVTKEQSVVREEDSKLTYTYIIDPDVQLPVESTEQEIRWADTREQLGLFIKDPVIPVGGKFDITQIVEEEKNPPGGIEGLQQNLQTTTQQIDAGYQAVNVNYLKNTAVVPKDKKLEFTELLVNQKKKYIDVRDKIVLAKTFESDVGYFTEEGSVVPINADEQIASVKYLRDKCRLKYTDIVMDETYRIRELIDPTESTECVNKRYCDQNSGRTGGGGGSFFSTLFGAIAGAIAGAITSLVTQNITNVIGTTVGQGLAAIGSFAQNGLFNSGMRTGGVADLEKMKDSASNGLDQLIDNELDDIANGGSASGDPVNGASIFSGPVGFDSLVRLARNSQIGLFDLAN